MPLQNYRPVVLMHGVLTGPLDMKLLKDRIQSAHPGTAVLNVDAYSYIASSMMHELIYGPGAYLFVFIESACMMYAAVIMN